jgi:hypothetical protein
MTFADRLRGSRGRDVAASILTSSWLLGSIVVVIAWRPLFTTPTAGFDPSWNLALEMAAADRLRWGTEFAFNYGPLGFLHAPLVAFTWPAILSVVHLLALRLALAVSVIWVARRRLGALVAVAMAFVIISLNGVGTAVPLAFIWCAVALSGDPLSPIAQRVVVFGGGFLSAIELLVKLNEGLLIAAMCLTATLAMPGRRSRNLAGFAIVLAGSLVVLWFAAGQGVSNVGDFLANSVELMRGYSSAMQEAGAVWPVVAALATGGLALAVAWLAAERGPIARRAGLLLLVAALWFVAWKEGFVRQSESHMAIFFGWMLAPWIGLRWPGRNGWPLVAAFAAVTALYFATTGLRPADDLRPVHNATTMAGDLRTVFDPGRRREVREGAARSMRSAYALDPRSVALLVGKTVAVWPWESGIAWAYGFDWKPIPTSRTTNAYTPRLDELTARALSSPEGPQRVLRHTAIYSQSAILPKATPVSIDGRYGAYDAPAATLALLCNFEALRTTPRYQVLGRVANRCGPERPLGSTTASYGEPVRVPRPPGAHQVVLVRVHGAAPSGLEALRTVLYRPPIRYVVFDQRRVYRMVPGVAQDGLILEAPDDTDFPRPFALAPNARTIELRKATGPFSPNRELGFDFYAMRVRPS